MAATTVAVVVIGVDAANPSVAVAIAKAIVPALRKATGTMGIKIVTTAMTIKTKTMEELETGTAREIGNLHNTLRQILSNLSEVFPFNQRLSQSNEQISSRTCPIFSARTTSSLSFLTPEPFFRYQAPILLRSKAAFLFGW